MKKKLARIHGIFPAVITVFDDNGTQQVGECERVCDWLLENGVHGLVPNGTSSEAFGLNQREHLNNVKAAVKASSGRAPVISGLICWNTAMACDMAKAAMDAGAMSLMTLMPYASMPPVEAVFDHLRAISDAAGVPLMLYNNPGEAGYEIDQEDVAMLTEEGTLFAMKSAHGASDRVNYTNYLCGDKLSILYGSDFSPLDSMAVGAVGWCAALPTVLPRHSVELYDAAVVEKDLPEAQDVWRRMIDYSYYFNYVAGYATTKHPTPHFIAMMKATLNLQGMNVGNTRAPVPMPTAEEQKQLEAYWDKHLVANAA